jgi:teichoic acid transport system ATP-binding protein
VRLLAPLALVACAVALFSILATGGDDDEPSGAATSERSPAMKPAARQRERPRVQRTYVVRPGDTPSAIAERVGVTVEQIQELNPGIDPQLLTPGQRLKIRP